MPKTITGSVGRGGKNYPPSDVMTIQYLLNCLTHAKGGPAKELAVDGAAGPKTIAAIEAFQRKIGGFADGRVDPGGATFRALQALDPFPNRSLPQSDAKSAGFAPAKGSAAKNSPFGSPFSPPQPGNAPGAPGYPGKNVPGMPPAKTGGMAYPGMAQPGVKDASGNGSSEKSGGTKNF